MKNSSKSSRSWSRALRVALFALVTAPPIQAAELVTTKDGDARLIIEVSSDRGATPVYEIHESMVVTVRASRAANAYCFYQQGDGKIIRIFPNRFHPSPAVPAGTQLRIPDETMKFIIRFDQALALEAVRCFANELDPPPSLPSSLASDQGPLPLADLEAVSAAFLGVAPASATATMSVTVIDAQPLGPR